MKIIGKFISAFLVATIIISAGALTGYSYTAKAAHTATFSLSLIEETDSSVIVSLNLESGSFNSLDMAFVTDSNISKCTKLVSSDEFRAFQDKAQETDNIIAYSCPTLTMRVSLSSTIPFSGKISLFVATFSKSSAAPVNSSDISCKIDICAISDEDMVTSNVNHSFTNNLPQYAGQCGKTLFYKYDSTSKELNIYGSGAMYDYDSMTSAPWNGVIQSVNKLNITGATSIGKYAFNSMKAATSVNLPSSVVSIGESAFAYTKNMKSINLDNVTTISKGAFKGCTALETAKLSDKLRAIPSEAFSNCTSLGEVTIPKSVTTVDSKAFTGCSSKLLIKCYIGSAAYKFCVNNSIKYELLDKYIIGDVNNDSVINSQDALMILNFAVLAKTPSDLEKITADLNNDGIFNSVDALITLQIAVGKVSAEKYQR